RTRSNPYAHSAVVRELGETGNYSVWADFDIAVHHFTNALTQPFKYQPLTLPLLPLPFDEGTAQDALFEKVQLAIAYGRDADALAIYSTYRTWVRPASASDDFACRYYTTIYQTMVRRGDYDRVINYFGMITGGEP